jgi:23S rRNA (guanosine2251-2'-O)-methyltransferase
MPIVCGIHPVLEALNAGSRTIERVVVTKGVRNKRILEVIKRASERGVPLRFEPREALDRAADGERHQGVLAIVADKGLLSLEELHKTARTPPLFMLLDGVEDPRNLGAIIRSVDAAGADGVLLPDRHTASLSDAAARTAAGALDSVKIARIGNVVQALETLKSKGFWIVGFDGSGKERWDAIDYKRPVVLVLGGEGKGIRRLVKEHCDHIVSLPVFGQVSSLNVSVAAGIALYEAVRQRGSVPTMARPIPPRALVAKKPVVIGPPPEDREEDPGVKRRAAAIASLALAAEPTPPGKPDAPKAEAPAGAEPAGTEEAEPNVPEASLEAVGPDDNGDTGDETRVARATRAVTDDVDDDDDDADGDDDSDEDASGDDVDDDGEDVDEDDDDAAGDDDVDDADEDGDGSDDGDSDDDSDDDDDDEDDADDDEDDQDEDEDEEDGEPADRPSDLAAPFMPEDNSGGGEVTWGSEKELHAHRPRREGERRFGNNGRRGGRPNDRKQRHKNRPAGQGQNGGRDQNRNQQQRRDPERPREPRPQTGEGRSAPQGDAENAKPTDTMAEGGASDPQAQRNGGVNRPGDQPANRTGRRRNRRRRGGRGRNRGDGSPGELNAPQGQPREGQDPPRDRADRPQGQPRREGENQGGGGPGRQDGDRPQREGGGEPGRNRRDRDRRRRRRRGRRGPGPGGGQNGGSGGSNAGGGSDQGGGSSGGSASGGGGGGSET